MAEPNHLLRTARQATASPASPGFALSRSELAELVNATIYRRTGRVAGLDGHYVAKLERGVIRWPGEEYRRAFREVLGAATDSELGFRRPRGSTDAAPPLRPLRSPTSDGEQERLTRILAGPCRVDDTTVRDLQEVLVRQHHLEDTIGSIRMLPIVLAEIDLAEHLIWHARGPQETALVTLVAEYHEFAGRMADYNGDHRAALYHDARALRTAREVNDPNLIAVAHGLRSHLAWGGRDSAATIAFAEAGQRDAHGLSAGVAGFLAQMQARGHAQQAESGIVERLLDRCEQLTAQAAEHPEDEPWWAYLQTTSRALFQRGVAYLELGRHREARDVIDEARTTLPDSFRRDHGRFAAALAVTCALDGDLAAAVTAAKQAIAIVADTGSVYTIADLRRTRGILTRQHPDQVMTGELDKALDDLSGEGFAG